MRRKAVLSLAVLAALARVTLAHEDNPPPYPGNSDPYGSAIVVPNWRDNWIPFFDGGDPKTRHDSDTTNNESRENPDTRQSMQRWRDETKTTGEVAEVGDGCNHGSCLAVSDQDGDLLRADATASLFTDGSVIPPFGGGTQEGDPNETNVEVAGAGAQADFGGAQDPTAPVLGPVLGPVVSAVDDPAADPIFDAVLGSIYGDDWATRLGSGKVISLPESLMDPTPTTDTDPDEANAPNQISVAYSADHSLGGWAHSPGGHGNGEFNQHDTHGGTISVDVYLPTADDPTRVRDSKYGLVVHDHLDCFPAGCFDEYHNVYPADPERTLYQVGEMPGQAEIVARDPDHWLWGKDSQDVLTPQVGPTAGSAFDEVNPYLDPAVSSATGVGEAKSPCCKANTDGSFCSRNAGGAPFGAVENQALAGCVEIDENNCFGGAMTAAGPVGCMVVNGEADSLNCTEDAVAACCANGACP